MEKEVVKNFYDLDVWKEGHSIVLEIYQITKNFPREEQFGLISQVRRAISSVTANIAEGFERYHYRDKIRFYYQARGSIAEVQNFLILSKDLQFINTDAFQNIMTKAQHVHQQLNGLIRSIEKQSLQDS